MICYKLTQENNTSFIVNGTAEITYELGKYVKGPALHTERGYHPTAFKTLEQAETFAQGRRWIIWKAEGKKRITPLPKMLLFWMVGSAQAFAPLMKEETWPEGTLMFESIKLLEKVVEG